MTAAPQKSQPKIARRTLRGAAWGLAGLAAAITVAAAVLFSSTGQALLTQWLLSALNSAPGQTVRVQSVAGTWPFDATFTGITIEDAHGPWLTADRLHLKIRASALLQARIALEEASAGHVVLLRLPESEKSDTPPRPLDVARIHGSLSRIEVETARIAQLDIADTVLGAPLRLDLEGALKPDGGGMALMARGRESGDGGTFTLDAHISPGTATVTLDGARGASSLKAEASLQAGDSGISGSATLRLDGAEPLLRHEAFTFGAAEANARLGGTLDSPQAAGTFRIEALVAADRQIDRLEGNLTVSLGSDVVAVSGNGTLADALRAFPEAAPLTAAEAAWDMAVQIPRGAGTIRLSKFSLASGGLALEGAADIEQDTIAGTLTASVAGVGKLLQENDTSSRLRATFTTQSLGHNGHGTGQITFDLTDPPALGGAADALLGKAIRGEASVSWNGETLNVSRATVTTAQAKLSSDAVFVLRPGTFSHSISTLLLEVNDAAVLLPGAAGPLRADAKASGPFDNFSADVKISASHFVREDVAVEEPGATLAFTFTAGKLSGDISAAGRWNGGQLLAAATFAGDPRQAVVIQNIRTEGIGGDISGTLTINPLSGLMRGLLTARFDDLTLPLALLDVPFTGAGTAELSLSDTDAQQSAALSVQARNVEGPAVTAETLELAITARNFSSDLTLTGTMTAHAGALAGQPFTTLRADLNGTPQSLNVKLAGKGTDARPFTLAAAAEIAATAETRITFSSLSVSESDMKLALEEPAPLTIGEGRITLPRAAFTSGGGTLLVMLEWDRSGGTVNGSIESRKFPMSAAPWLGADLGFDGVMDGRLTIVGRDTNPALDAAFTLSIPPQAATGLPAITARFTAAAGDGRMSAALAVEGLSPEPARAEAALPFQLDLAAGRIVLPMEEPASAAIVWRGDIAPLWQLLPVIDHDLRGTADINIAMSGTLASPAFTGAARIDGGVYENITLGTVARDLALSLTADGQNALAFNLTAGDGGRGTLTGSGRFTRGGTQGPAADISAQFTDFNLVQRDDVHIRASGELTYDGPAMAGTLKGTVRASAVDVRLGGTYVPDVPLLTDMNGAPSASAERGGRSIKLDVAVDMPGTVRVEGRGLSSVWRGKLALAGTGSNPDLTGTMELERGDFTFLGRGFDLTAGNVRFTGGGTIDPDLAITAERSSASVTAIVTITGRARSPSIELSSRPAMARDEVLSRLLFDRGAGQLGPLETVQLANAVTELTNIASDGGVVGVLRRTFGLEVLGFGGSSGNAVVVGQRLGRNIYVGVEQGLESGSSQVVVQWRLTPSLSLTSRADAEAGAGLGLSWSRDY